KGRDPSTIARPGTSRGSSGSHWIGDDDELVTREGVVGLRTRRTIVRTDIDSSVTNARLMHPRFPYTPPDLGPIVALPVRFGPRGSQCWAKRVQTPEEMYFGTGARVPCELAAARHAARRTRLETPGRR